MRSWSVIAVVLAACSAGKAPVDDSFDDLDGLDSKSDAFSYRLKMVGNLPGGQEMTVHYTKHPRFRGVYVPGVEGREVDIRVHSDDGDAVTWLLDKHFRVIAKNDDADDSTFDSHIHTVLPASQDNTYMVVFRDYSLESHDFTIAYNEIVTNPPAGGVTGPQVDAFLPLYQAAGAAFATDSHVVGETTLPTPVRTAFSEFVGAANTAADVVAWKFDAAGAPAYAVMTVIDTSYFVSVFDNQGTWVAHGHAPQFNVDNTLAWDLDIEDPTLCRCGLAPDNSGFAGCEWVDGNRYGSDISDCD